MAPDPPRGPARSRRRTGARRRSSVVSSDVGSVVINNNLQSTQPAPSHTQSTVWKSDSQKEREEYERVRQRVRRLAPQMFTQGCDIFPLTAVQYVEHKRGWLLDQEDERNANCEKLKAKIAVFEKIPKHGRKVKSVFGEEGKVLNDVLSPVLSLPTIWSAAYCKGENVQQITPWPSPAELQWNGDSRQGAGAKTKCGRFLPLPRTRFLNTLGLILPRNVQGNPLDQVGPVFDHIDLFAENIRYCNAITNNCAVFKAEGEGLLGEALVKELG